MNLEDKVLQYFNWYVNNNDTYYNSLANIYKIKVYTVDNKYQSSSCKFQFCKTDVHVTIRINLYQARQPVLREYCYYKDDPEIGDYSGRYIEHLNIIICHEIAHIFTFLESIYIPDIRTENAHGITFQEHYRQLRNNFVNKVA